MDTSARQKKTLLFLVVDSYKPSICQGRWEGVHLEVIFCLYCPLVSSKWLWVVVRLKLILSQHKGTFSTKRKL